MTNLVVAWMKKIKKKRHWRSMACWKKKILEECQAGNIGEDSLYPLLDLSDSLCPMFMCAVSETGDSLHLYMPKESDNHIGHPLDKRYSCSLAGSFFIFVLSLLLPSAVQARAFVVLPFSVYRRRIVCNWELSGDGLFSVWVAWLGVDSCRSSSSFYLTLFSLFFGFIFFFELFVG